MVNARRNVERFAPVKARMIRLTILATSDRTEPCLDEVEVYTAPDAPTNVALASAGGEASASSEYPNAAIHKIAHLNDGRVGNSWSWISRVPGRGSITIAWREPATIDRVVWGRDREEAIVTAWRPNITWRQLSSRGGGRSSHPRLIAFGLIPVDQRCRPLARARPRAGGRPRACRADGSTGEASGTAVGTGGGAQGLHRHVQRTGADAPFGTR